MQCPLVKFVQHPKPYNVSWVNNASIAIKERCLFPIKVLDYHDKIWCDIIPMDIRYVILGRPQLYDLEVTIFERSNSCSFTFYSKKIQLIKLPQRPNDSNTKKEKVKEKRLNIISHKKFEKKVREESIMFVLIAKKVIENFSDEPPKEIKKELKEFLNVFPSKLPYVLPLYMTFNTLQILSLVPY